MDMSALNYRAYNLSTEHETIMNTTQSTSPDSDHYYVDEKNAVILFDDGTSNDEQYEETAENVMPGFEIIAVDPNCYYSTDEDDDIDVEAEFDDEEECHEIIQEKCLTVHTSIQIPTINGEQPPAQLSVDGAFDIIDETVLNEHDNILFTEDTTDQFDLASYIAGEASSLILSPLAPTKLNSSKFNKQNTITKIPQTKSQQENSPIKNGRSKRRNLTKAFIDTDDDSDTNVSNKVHKDTDPVWDPNANNKNEKFNKKNTKVKKTIPIHASATPSASSATQSTNNLRSMLKKQMLSDRPMTSNKLTKMISTKNEVKNVSPIESSKTSTQEITKERKLIGLGRGKNINFTAKHFDLSDSSDNPDRDSTDNENSSDENEFESEKSSALVIQKVPIIEKEESNTKLNVKSQKNSAEVKKKIIENKSIDTKVKPIAAGPVLIDSDSIDNNDFAKAIFVDAKGSAKTSTKKNIPEKRKLPPIINAGNRFKTNSINRPLIGRPFADLKPIINDVKQLNVKISSLPRIPLKSAKEATTEIKPIEENSIDSNDSKSNDIDVVAVDEVKTEQAIKKKLNIHEYLKRKGVNATGAGGKQKCEINISSQKTENKAENEDTRKTNSNSLYEEIIIVSIGCGTNISIPELSFGNKISSINDNIAKSKSTVLLSDIQTTIVKANSAIEQGKISSTSLISSIQNVLIKKSSTENQNESNENGKIQINEKNAEEVPEHGENKVIMHLRKDRVKPKTSTIALQTEPYFQFPPLERIPISKKSSPARAENASTEQHRSNRNYRQKNMSESSSYYSGEDHAVTQRRSRHSEFIDSINHLPYDSDRPHSNQRISNYRRNHYSRQRTISRSLSQSSDTSTSSSDSSSSSSSSSSASSVSSAKSLNSYGDSSTKSYYNGDRYIRHRYRPQYNSRSNSRSRPSSVRSNSPEERRIVYVGRLEPDKSKDDLRRIFSVYGPIINISMHYKEIKHKYGFVTFARPADAYNAIDDRANNPTIKNYDVSFGGRRAFCRDKYLDLDNIPSSHANSKKSDQDDSFEVLLRKMKKKLQEAKE